MSRFVVVFLAMLCTAAVSGQYVLTNSVCTNNNCYNINSVERQACVEVISDSSGTQFDRSGMSSSSFISSATKRVMPQCLPVQQSEDYCGPENGGGGPYIMNNFRYYPCQPDEQCRVSRRCASAPQYAPCFTAVTCTKSNYNRDGGGFSNDNNNINSASVGNINQCGNMVCNPNQQCIILKTYPTQYRCVGGGMNNYNNMMSDNSNRLNDEGFSGMRRPVPVVSGPKSCSTLQCSSNRPSTVCIKVLQDGMPSSAGSSSGMIAQCVPQANDVQEYCSPRLGLCPPGSQCAVALPKCRSNPVDPECTPFVTCRGRNTGYTSSFGF